MKNKNISFWIVACIVFISKLPAQSQITMTFDILAPVCSTDSLNCAAMVTFPFSISAENDQNLMLSHQILLPDSTLVQDVYGILSGHYPAYEISGNYPIGAYQFVLEVSDGVGTDTIFLMPFEVVDCQMPEVSCYDSLIVYLFPTEPNTDADGDGDDDRAAGAAWAIDLLPFQLEDCSLPLKYSINRKGEMVDEHQTGIIVTCDDTPTLVAEVYIWDTAFNPYSVQPDSSLGGPNYRMCEVELLFNDFFDACEVGPIDIPVYGTITTPMSRPIEGVQVQVTGSLYSDTLFTDSEGNFSSNFPVAPATYVLTPKYEGSPLNGVTAQDMILIRKHILNISKLNNPYSLLAADINGSGHISTRDLVDLQRVILGIESNLPNGINWRLVPFDYTFPNTSNPWQETIPHENEYDILNLHSHDGDFIGIKIGDVNHSAN